MTEPRSGRRSLLLPLSLALNAVLVVAVAILIVVIAASPCKLASRIRGEDIEAIGHLALQIQCGEGDQHACDEVLNLEREGCEDGDGAMCTLMGIQHETGRHVSKDDRRALEHFEKACDLDDGAGCWYAGSRHMDGRGTQVDLQTAIGLLRKACNLDEVNGCVDLGDAYMKIEPPDEVHALEAYDEGCDLDYDLSCSRASGMRQSSGG